MMGLQWHQLDHMQIICTSFQTGYHARQYLTTQFLQAGCPSCRQTYSVKALLAKESTTLNSEQQIAARLSHTGPTMQYSAYM